MPDHFVKLSLHDDVEQTSQQHQSQPQPADEARSVHSNQTNTVGKADQSNEDMTASEQGDEGLTRRGSTATEDRCGSVSGKTVSVVVNVPPLPDSWRDVPSMANADEKSVVLPAGKVTSHTARRRSVVCLTSSI